MTAFSFLSALVIVLMAVLPTATSIAQPLTLQKNLDDIYMEFGVDRRTLAENERLHFSITVDTPLTAIVQFQAIDESIGPFKVLSRYPRGPLDTNDPDRKRWQRRYQLQPEKAGEYEIPSLTVVFFEAEQPVTRTPCISADRCNRISGLGRNIEVDLADSRHELSSDPIVITVTEATPVADQRTGQTLQLRLLGQRPWPMAALVVLALLAGILWLLRSRRRIDGHCQNAQSAKPTALPVDDSAVLQALDELSRQDPDGPQRSEEFYDRLAAIMRRYLAGHFQIPPPKTTEELLAAIDGGPIAAHRHELGRLLRQLDLVRFGRYRPPADDSRQMLASVKAFIEQTHPDRASFRRISAAETTPSSDPDDRRRRF